MRKIVGWTLISYVLFGLFIAMYIFYWADTSIPIQYRGSGADPSTFLNERELMLSEEYSQIRNLLFFLSLPFEWIIYLFVLVLGISYKFNTWAQITSKRKIAQIPIYVFWLSIFVGVLTLPLSWISFTFSKMYNISTQSTSGWLKDRLIDFWLDFGFLVMIAYALFFLITKAKKRWWFYAWVLSIPFSLFLMFVQPVIIDPLYNDFYELKNKELEAEILQMAKQANIPADHVFEVNMSEKTNALNAYVTGIGNNSRIVLWDTTLNRLNEQEILFIMAHEMGHYVKKHIYFGIAGYLILSLIGLYLTSKILHFCIHRWKDILHIRDLSELHSLPLLLLVFSMLTFLASPLENVVSRYQEHTADVYAIDMTMDNEAAIQTFQELSRAGLSQVNPPFIVKIFRYGHPTILERIAYIEERK
ncbi:M48 family metallopeptidase [Bacillus sp. SM2101]|uniref:M48 family metallopeptidase n=1 Tax=Bacillus sp. SM2101 TaxID=2805366 RepID=UPI001BDE0C1D|nr:M48 family metallopeptidase [Bacillus sp. SM2101]